jgi:hypothetical protein
VRDKCEWGKLHPKYFPTGFKACDIVSDGWTLLKDDKDETIPSIIYWKKVEEE